MISDADADPPPWLDPLYTHGRTDIQTDGDYIKHVAYGPSGATCLKIGREVRWYLDAFFPHLDAQ